MAEPIRMVKRSVGGGEQPAAPGWQEMAAKYAPALEETLELLAVLREKGILRTLRDVAASGEEVLEILVHQVNTQGGKRLLKNAVALGEVLASVDLQGAAETAKIVAEGLRQPAGAREWEHRPPGMMDLFRAIRDPDVAAGLLILLRAAKVIGAAARGAETGTAPRP
ncbi:DUF1641 domain-containing protein [Kyrpidia spormannii]|uniref:DUF1641 domain-containing protein n=1 Tax=Kyrpidia spormannii TaxID=2055160 RepID=UPI001300164E|nr:DUF1641 domain-containing protein [Kyrpidia spormannii]